MTEAHIIIEDVAQNDAAKHVKLVSISGQLDESNIDEKAQEIYAIITANPQGLYLIFDFEKLEYMNSKSIGYLTDWFGKVTEGQGKIVMIKAQPNIIDILQVIGLTQLIPMYGSLEEAKFALLNATAPAPTPSPSEPVISAPAPTPTPAAPSTPAVPVVAPVAVSPVQEIVATPVATTTPAPSAEPTLAPAPTPPAQPLS